MHNVSNQMGLLAEVNSLTDLYYHRTKIDNIITCTGSQSVVLTEEVYKMLNPSNKKLSLWIWLCRDCAESLQDFNEVDLITVNELKTIAEKNLKARTKEVEECKVIIKNQMEEYKHCEKQRELERAMQSVPARIKGIREKAISEVFAKEMDNLDPNVRKIVDDVIDYMEKKYISVPMKMAKEILLKEAIK